MSSSSIDTALTPRDVPERQSRRRSPIRFIRNVIAELRKVVWPTRKETIKYSIVVLFTLVFMLAIILFLDGVFGDASLFLFK